MSKTDNARLPRIGKRVIVTESDDMGMYSFTLVNNEARREVQRNHEDKRANAEARVLRNREVADLDMREQVRDALYSAPYEGPVGTRVQDTPVPDCESVTIEPVVPTHKTVRKTEQELREEIRRVRASRMRDEQDIERIAREHGFGQRMSGVTGL